MLHYELGARRPCGEQTEERGVPLACTLIGFSILQQNP